MIASRRVATLAPLVLVLSMVLAPLAAHSVTPAKPPNPLSDPTSNTMPSQRFMAACGGMGTSKAANVRCDKAALKDFDAVRKKEGLGPMALPHDFTTLSVASQLLAISDIERVDRGRRAVKGRSTALDKLAVKGAKADTDPPFPNPCNCDGGGNWAGAGNSVLLDDFYWMYDDGLGSFNGDCTQSNTSGCWGHRHNILNAYPTPVVMGAAVAYNTRFGTSMTEEFIGGNSKFTANVSPTWHTIAATFAPRIVLTASTTQVASGQAVTLTGTVTARVAHTAVAGQLLALQRRPGPSSSWHRVVRRHSSAQGVVRFVVHPGHSESYRLVALTKTGAHDGASAVVRVLIA